MSASQAGVTMMNHCIMIIFFYYYLSILKNRPVNSDGYYTLGEHKTTLNKAT